MCSVFAPQTRLEGNQSACRPIHSYELDGTRIDYLPTASEAQKRCTPIYEEMEGWHETTEGARSWADLPANAIKYVRRVEELIDCPVALLSTSPEREDTILVTDPFAD